jgi:two-component system phosphate regulon sensor histidine kinase PhoR
MRAPLPPPDSLPASNYRVSTLGHRLALKVGLSSALGMGFASLVLYASWSAWTPWVSAVAILLTFLGGYASTLHHASKRLQLARTILRNLRRHEFDTLDLAQVERGDELNDIIRQVYRTGRVLEREFSELRKMENYRREFLGNISHELKTPIFSIRGFAETLNEGAIEDPTVNRSFVEKIIRNADRLSNLARDLAEISRLETGQLAMNMTAFNMKRLVTDVVESVEPQARERSITLRTAFDSGLPPVQGDSSQIRQVVVNLVDNAIKYSHEGGTETIELKARRSGSQVQLLVKDQGVGVSKDDIGRLTERFFRVDKSRSRSAGGTGLGLSIVKHILAAHGEELDVSSTLGKGSVFSFSLGVASAEEGDASA